MRTKVAAASRGNAGLCPHVPALAVWILASLLPADVSSQSLPYLTLWPYDGNYTAFGYAYDPSRLIVASMPDAVCQARAGELRRISPHKPASDACSTLEEIFLGYAIPNGCTIKYRLTYKANSSCYGATPPAPTFLDWPAFAPPTASAIDRYHDKKDCGPRGGNPIFPLTGSKRQSEELGTWLGQRVALTYDTRAKSSIQRSGIRAVGKGGAVLRRTVVRHAAQEACLSSGTRRCRARHPSSQGRRTLGELPSRLIGKLHS